MRNSTKLFVFYRLSTSDINAPPYRQLLSCWDHFGSFHSERSPNGPRTQWPNPRLCAICAERHCGKRRGFTRYRHSPDAGGRDTRVLRGNTEQRGLRPCNKTHLSAHQSATQGQHWRPIGALWMNYGASLAMTRSHKEGAPRRAERGAVEEQKDTFYLHKKRKFNRLSWPLGILSSDHHALPVNHLTTYKSALTCRILTEMSLSY